VDLQGLASWAVDYGIQLASRLGASLAVMAVVTASAGKGASASGLSDLDSLNAARHPWLERVVEQCHLEGVNLEIFFACGPFLEEIMGFVRSQGALQFIILGLPRDSSPEVRPAFLAALRPLHRLFEGEILLVREQGKVTSISDLNG
jgi:hypothetical protein